MFEIALQTELIARVGRLGPYGYRPQGLASRVQIERDIFPSGNAIVWDSVFPNPLICLLSLNESALLEGRGIS